MEETNKTEDRLAVFLWILIRDHLSFGKLEKILHQHVDKLDYSERFHTAEPNLDEYCRRLARALLTGERNQKKA